MLAPHFEHKLFLTATPHNGYPESFTALLELLDNQRFARGTPPDRKQLDAVMVRRLKSELPPDFAGRILEQIADKENIQASDADLDVEVERFAQQSRQPVEAVRKKLTDEGTLERMRDRIRNEKTLDFLYQRSA